MSPGIPQDFSEISVSILQQNPKQFLHDFFSVKFLRDSYKNSPRIPPRNPPRFLQKILWVSSRNSSRISPVFLQGFLWDSSRDSSEIPPGISARFIQGFLREITRDSSRNSFHEFIRNFSGIPPEISSRTSKELQRNAAEVIPGMSQRIFQE